MIIAISCYNGKVSEVYRMGVKQLIGRIRKADKDYGLINNGDRICIGVSGGKDSMMLLYCMHLYRRVAKRFDDKDFEIVGVHLNMGFPDMDFEPVRQWCAKQGIPFEDVDTKIYEILKMHPKDDGNIQCSLCSKLKKGAIVQEAIRLNCNKTAFAHHADDAIETLFMNGIYGGRLATFSPQMHLSRTEMDFIRPFIYCFESDINKSARELNIPIVKSTCPMDGYTSRQDIKDLLHSIYHQYPMAKQNFLLMLHNTKQTDLWVKVSNEDDQTDIS